MAKYTNFKFGKHVPTDSADTTPEKFWALNANSCKMSKDTNF